MERTEMSESEEEESLIKEKEKFGSSIDEVIQQIGEFERYQWLVSVLLCVTLIPVGSHVLMMYFAALNPSWRCVRNSTDCVFNGTLPPTNTSRCSIPRSEWEYTEEKHYSIVTEFDLYCHRSWIIDFSNSVLFLGALAGSPVMGWLADAYGRRKVLFFSTGVIIALGTTASFMGNVYAVVVIRFFIGVFLCGAYQSSVLLTEIVASRYRPLCSNLIWGFYPIVLCILGVKAYFIRSWKLLMLLTSAPYGFVLLFYFLVLESPRWLRIKGRTSELYDTLRRMAKVNRKHFPDDLTVSSPEEMQHKSNPLHLFRTRSLAKITIIMGYTGFSLAITYYGLALTASQLGGSLYLNFILFSLSDIPGVIGILFLASRVGRKKTSIVSIFCTGICCATLIFLPENQHKIRISLGMLGKVFLNLSWNGLTIWIMELYPTTLRSQAFSVNNSLTTIGSASAPWMVTGLELLHRSGPFICMSCVAVSCSLLLCLLQDTTGLPTLEEEEEGGGRKLVIGVVEDKENEGYESEDSAGEESDNLLGNASVYLR